MDIKIGQLKPIIKKYIEKKKPLMIHGAPGIGKSDSVREAAKEVAKEKGMEFVEGTTNEDKFSLIDVRISQLDPSDLRGIPFPNGDTTKWLVPNWLPTGGEGVLFFDEINLAPPSIQASSFQLILDRKLGDYTLPDGWMIVAAGNRAEDQANVFPMAAPLKNRFSHTTLLVPSEEEWRMWAMDNGIKSDIIAFLAFKKSLLFKFDKNNKDFAFPTPRTWSLASHMVSDLNTSDLKGRKFDDVLDEEKILVASCVGEGCALEYSSFVKLKNRINLDEILKKPELAKKITEPDLKYSMVSGFAEKYKHNRKVMPQILEAIDYIDAEFGIFCLRLMKGMGKKNEFENDVVESKQWKKLFHKYGKYIF